MGASAIPPTSVSTVAVQRGASGDRLAGAAPGPVLGAGRGVPATCMPLRCPGAVRAACVTVMSASPTIHRFGKFGRFRRRAAMSWSRSVLGMASFHVPVGRGRRRRFDPSGGAGGGNVGRDVGAGVGGVRRCGVPVPGSGGRRTLTNAFGAQFGSEGVWPGQRRYCSLRSSSRSGTIGNRLTPGPPNPAAQTRARPAASKPQAADANFRPAREHLIRAGRFEGRLDLCPYPADKEQECISPEQAPARSET